MMAKKKSLAVVVAMAAMTATTAVPAFAQEGEVAAHPVGPAEGGQYAPVGPTQQEAAPALAPVAGSGQYAPVTSGEYGSISGAPASAELGKQTTITGVFSVEEGGFSFVIDEKTGQEYYLVGVIGLDPQATAGKRVVAKGEALCGYDGPVYGCTLGVSSITPIGKGAEKEAAPAEPAAPTDDTASDEQILPFEVTTGGDEAEDGASPERQDGTGANDEGAAVISGDTSNDKGGAPGVDSKRGGAPKGTNAVLLPSTGGVLPIAGLAGLVIVGAGLVVRGKFAR